MHQLRLGFLGIIAGIDKETASNDSQNRAETRLVKHNAIVDIN